MTYLPDYKAPFIFANFNGTSGDVDVMTHECGHAFQDNPWQHKILSGNMQILVWKLQRFTPCPWNSLQNPGIICFSEKKLQRIIRKCIWKMLLSLFLMDVW